VIAELIVLHLGALHSYEKVLTFGLAFGPFIVLGAVVAVRRRQDHAAEAQAAAEAAIQAQSAISSPEATADRPEPPARTP
jgi:hypothetical protein